MAQPKHNERKAQPVDAHVGRRLRMRRALLGVSQEKLAESVGITFQQLQKYERGANRVSASRLYQFSQSLDVPVDYFFQEYIDSGRKARHHGLADSTQDSFETADQKLYTRETLDLLKLYYSIKDDEKRKKLMKTIRSMVESLNLSIFAYILCGCTIF